MIRGETRHAGFSLLEAIVSVAALGLIVISLGSVTGQWLPNWRRGFGTLQNVGSLDAGLRRIVADIEGAEFVTANARSKITLFFGDTNSMMFVRRSIEPNSPPHLAFVQLAEEPGRGGMELRRSEVPFTPLAPEAPPSAPGPASGAIALVGHRYRVSFAYAGVDSVWKAEWRDSPVPPSSVRVDVRDRETGRLLPYSTVASLNVDLPPECVVQISARKCLAEGIVPPAKTGEP